MADSKQPPAALDSPSSTFSCDVVVYRRDADGNVMKDEQGQDIVDRQVGHFVFRVPTLSDYLEIGVRRAARLRGLMGAVDENTEILSQVFATLPFLSVEIPQGWDWQRLYPKDMEAVVAVYEAYNVGLDRF